MWFNQAKCDIYMGTGAGTKLLKEIGNAQESVKISSPYLSPRMVEELVCLHKKGIKVSLITSDTLNSNNYRQQRCIKQLIVQNKNLRPEADRARKRLKTMALILIYAGVLFFFASIILFITTRNLHFLQVLVFSITFICLSKFFNQKLRTIRLFEYKYTPLFPFKVFVAPESSRINEVFIHGKIYIIDGRTAYLGSLNFTESGTKYNYETRIRITEEVAVKKIDEEYDKLYYNPEMAFFGVEEWGSYLYPEPIN